MPIGRLAYIYRPNGTFTINVESIQYKHAFVPYHLYFTIVCWAIQSLILSLRARLFYSSENLVTLSCFLCLVIALLTLHEPFLG
jgi:hypothetical protein